MLPRPGDAYLIPSGPNRHLHFVVLGPRRFPERPPQDHVLLVNVTSISPGIPHDPTCVLDVGDHERIHHPSFIAYRHARLDPVAHVTRMLETGAWQPMTPASEELLTRLRDGLKTSRMVPRWLKSEALL